MDTLFGRSVKHETTLGASNTTELAGADSWGEPSHADMEARDNVKIGCKRSPDMVLRRREWRERHGSKAKPERKCHARRDLKFAPRPDVDVSPPGRRAEYVTECGQPKAHIEERMRRRFGQQHPARTSSKRLKRRQFVDALCSEDRRTVAATYREPILEAPLDEHAEATTDTQNARGPFWAERPGIDGDRQVQLYVDATNRHTLRRVWRQFDAARTGCGLLGTGNMDDLCHRHGSGEQEAPETKRTVDMHTTCHQR